MREIVTLQLGSLANHVGTHYWNAQEEYFSFINKINAEDKLDHNVLYRQGETSSGIATYSPRTLIYDLKDGFGSLQKYNRLFAGNDSISDNVTWEQGLQKINRPLNKSKYQQELDCMEVDSEHQMDQSVLHQLDESVKNWSDYNRIYYHPRSINHIVTHEIENDITPFDNFNIGRQAYRDNEKELELFDENFRYFVEECDNLQGFQMMVDVDNAFGGFAEGLLNDIRDEFAKVPIFLYALSESRATYHTERQKQKIYLNRALSLTRLSQLSSVYIPIYTPTQATVDKCGLSSYLHFNDSSKYHTSGIIAAAIDNNSIPYRLKRPQLSMGDAVTRIAQTSNTRLASLSISLPSPITDKGYAKTLEILNTAKITRPLIPLIRGYSTETVNAYSEMVVTRGFPAGNSKEKSAYLGRMMSTFKDPSDPLHTSIDIEAALPLPDSFPHIFKPCLDKDGHISQSKNIYDSPQSVPVLTYFESGPRLKGCIDQHLKDLDTIVYKDFHEYVEGEMPITREDFLQMKEELITLSDTYNNEDVDM